MSSACAPKTTAAPSTYPLYKDQKLSSLNRMMLPAGNARSSMPCLRTSRQSKCGTMTPAEGGITVGDVPAATRSARSATRAALPSTLDT